MQEQNYPIKSWSKDERPREKLLREGPKSLSNAELLALIIRNGTLHKSALDLARELMKLGSDNLVEFGRLSAHDLMRVKGIGEAKAICITASIELGRRRQASKSLERTLIRSSTDMANYLQARLSDLQREVFMVIFMNRANKILHEEIISEGGITGTVADPRIILKKALELNAVNLILSHNHPSGSLVPSQADKALTLKVKQAAAFLDISICDHIIVSSEGYFSFADEGLI